MSKESENNKLVSKKTQSMTAPDIHIDTPLPELMKEAEIYFKSGLAPAHFKNVEALTIGMKWAEGLGIHKFLGLRDIFVIDNIPALKTEAAMALVEISGYCEYIEQEFIGTPYEDEFTAVCKIKLKDRKEHISTFSVKDAKTAMLWGKKTNNGKPTAWITYPKRMLMYRAIGFAIRDVAPHIIRGAKLYEELIDYSQYEIVEDKSTESNVDVVVQKKTSYIPHKDIFNDEPPIE